MADQERAYLSTTMEEKKAQRRALRARKKRLAKEKKIREARKKRAEQKKREEMRKKRGELAKARSMVSKSKRQEEDLELAGTYAGAMVDKSAKHMEILRRAMKKRKR